MSEPFLGEVVIFAGNFAPRGWAFCQGQILPIAQNTALFSILGTTYGGNGQTTFALPDLRGRAPIGAGQGPGLSNYTLGEMSGTETVTLISTQMPTHTHSVNAVSGPAGQPSPSGNLWADVIDSGGAAGLGYSNSAPNATMAATAIGVAGGNQPHNNLQPFLAINYIIAIEGIFPSRN